MRTLKVGFAFPISDVLKHFFCQIGYTGPIYNQAHQSSAKTVNHPDILYHLQSANKTLPKSTYARSTCKRCNLLVDRIVGRHISVPSIALSPPRSPPFTRCGRAAGSATPPPTSKGKTTLLDCTASLPALRVALVSAQADHQLRRMTQKCKDALLMHHKAGIVTVRRCEKSPVCFSRTSRCVSD